MKLSRRRFLAYSGASAALVGAGWLGLRDRIDRRQVHLVQQLIDGEPPEIDVSRVAKAYLAQHPEEQGREQLLQLLDLDPGFRLFRNARRLRRLRRNVLRDLDEERFVEVEGWLLTRTEARLYALAAAR